FIGPATSGRTRWLAMTRALRPDRKNGACDKQRNQQIRVVDQIKPERPLLGGDPRHGHLREAAAQALSDQQRVSVDCAAYHRRHFCGLAVTLSSLRANGSGPKWPAR